MPLVTCAALLASLANPVGGTTFQLSENCANVVVKTYYKAPLIIDAAGHTITYFFVTKDAGNITLKNGRVTAQQGESGLGPPGYAVLLKSSRNVTIDNMVFFNFNRGVVTDYAEGVVVKNSRFEMGHDGIISNAGGNLTFSDNTFIGVSFIPTTCKIDTAVERGLSRRACVDKGGNWFDGWHQDAIQLRNGIDGALITGNKVSGTMQGIGQMDAPKDLPPNNIVIRNNDVSVFGFHSITMGNSTNVEIIGNKVAQETGRRTIIRYQPNARVCGNKIQRPTDPGGKRC